ncbi:forkhead box Q2-like protein [Elysia marginata]|uniref:Forkhead box Q2-like protein n=1 Tax=Elysia marginata TaxID=1093978 RepID=A0AAV4GIG5_9GAST|nr:forkhead box Q2-like protein [Elysia marginata]
MCAPSQSAMLPYNLKIPSPYFPFGPSSGGINQAHLSALDFQRSQLNDYNVRVQLGLRNYQNSLGLSPFHSYITDPYSQAFFYKHDPRARFVQEEPKPSHSYIGLIAMAILSSKEKKLVLSDIYQWILDNYPYFRSRGPGWRNSIRHNLSLNDCFIKSGRSANGKGHYWAVHPANVEDFERGDFRRRRAQRKVRRHMGLSVPDDDDSPSPSPTQPWPLGVDADRQVLEPARSHVEDHKPLDIHNPQVEGLMLSHTTPVFLPGLRKPSKRRLFDMASLLAPDDDDENDAIGMKMQREDTSEALKATAKQSCYDSRCLSPNGNQDCRSPCSRSGVYCPSDEDDNDDDNEEIEVASRPSSPIIDLKETNNSGENIQMSGRLSVNIEDNTVQNLSSSLHKEPGHISNGALDLSSPSSVELEGRSPYTSRTDPSSNMVRSSLVAPSSSSDPLVTSESSQTMSSPVGNTKPQPDLSQRFDSPEEGILRDANVLTNGGACEDRPNISFMPPTPRMEFDISKLNSESMHYFRMQLQGGNRRAMDIRGLGMGTEPRFDLKLGLSDMPATFPGVDFKNHPDFVRHNPTSPVERHQMASPEAFRLASMGVRWTPPGLLRGSLPARDNLGMFSALGARPTSVYSPFQAVSFPLQPQRGMPALNHLRCNLPSNLLPMVPAAASTTSPSSSSSPSSLTQATASSGEAPALSSASPPLLTSHGSTSPVANVPSNSSGDCTSVGGDNNNSTSNSTSQISTCS